MEDTPPAAPATTTDPNALWTEKEVAAWARVSTRTMHKWAVNGIGPRRIWLGGRVRYRVADVLAWASSRAEDEVARAS